MILKRYETQNSNFQKVWDFYIKFYTAWLTINLLGLALVVQHIDVSNRWPVVAAFIIQNLLTSVTGFMVSRYSKDCSKELKNTYNQALREVTNSEDEFDDLKKSPVPEKIAVWGGIANGLACIFLAMCWLAINFIPKAN